MRQPITRKEQLAAMDADVLCAVRTFTDSEDPATLLEVEHALKSCGVDLKSIGLAIHEQVHR